METNSGDTAWILTSSAFVLLMTPGLALFYGGLVRSKNILSVLMQCLISAGLFGVLWIVVGLALVTTVTEFIDGVNARRKRTQEAPLNALWRLLRLQRRKYGGYLVHVGIILMALGIVGTRMYPFEVQKTLNVGQPATVGDYTITFERLDREFIDDYTSTWATVPSLAAPSTTWSVSRSSSWKGSNRLVTTSPPRPSGAEPDVSTLTLRVLSPFVLGRRPYGRGPRAPFGGSSRSRVRAAGRG